MIRLQIDGRRLSDGSPVFSVTIMEEDGPEGCTIPIVGDHGSANRFALALTATMQRFTNEKIRLMDHWTAHSETPIKV